MSSTLTPREEDRLGQFARAMIDQTAARVIVPPQQASTGFWFGGGNMICDAAGHLLVVGRYRNFGDSRTGLNAGQRGLELAIFRSTDHGDTFEKVISFSKQDLNVNDWQVLSIEGSALHRTRAGVELFVSTEKSGIGYPEPWESHLKPGTGVWTIDRMAAASVEELAEAKLEVVIAGSDPATIHAKDPFCHETAEGDFTLGFCTHPFSWASSNTALAARQSDSMEFGPIDHTFFPRGHAWDVAITRATCVLDVPPVGLFRDRKVSLVFYDGGESLRNLDEHKQAVSRPRGYSCEELGGVAYVVDGNWQSITRLSKYQPWFISPYGTGCSRYVDVLTTNDGFYATWQQSQSDLSQPLVMHRLERAKAEELLS